MLTSLKVIEGVYFDEIGLFVAFQQINDKIINLIKKSILFAALSIDEFSELRWISFNIYQILA